MRGRLEDGAARGFVQQIHGGTQTWLSDVRELFGMVPREAACRAFDRLPRAVRDRTVSAVLRGAPLRWALPYAITRGIRALSWLAAR